MTEGNEFHPPKIYAIWVDARPESPMAGLSGFLSENSRRLFFTERGDAELKIRDMEALRLNRHPAAEYRCVEYPGGYDAERSIQAELLKTISLQADPEIMRYEVTDRIYGNTGGGCMVGTLAVRLPDLDNMQMQTFINGDSVVFAANQREKVNCRKAAREATLGREVRDLHDLTGALQAQPGMKQQTFVAGFSAGAGAKAGSIGYSEKISPTLKGTASGNCMPSVLCLNDQGGSVMDCTVGITGTLRAQEHGHQPLVYENHGIDARYTGPHTIAPTLSARAGTGGNNLPLVEQRDAAHGSPSEKDGILYARQRVDVFHDNDVASTESARQYKDATDLVCQQADSRRLIRRLTPLECERLQGFPDGWTALSDASDSARYRALGNSVAIPCVEFIMRGITIAVSY
uniref:DNA cytosine methyltransferase n=1 Tax=Flavonifractor plautii TaxID=292800 RepID=UPI00384F517B